MDENIEHPASVKQQDAKDVAKQWNDSFSDALLILAPGAKHPLKNDWPNVVESEDSIAQAVATGHNVGLKTSLYPAIDIEDTAYSQDIMDRLRDWFGDVPVRSRAGSASHAILTRLTGEGVWASHSIKVEIDGELRPVMEILGRGRQLHVWGTRADKGGVALEWDKQPTAENVPEVTLGDLSQLVEDIRNMLTAKGAVTNVNRLAGQRVSGVDKDLLATRAELEYLMARIPNDERFAARDDWMRMLHALHGASQGEAKDLWEAWCESVPQGEDVGTKWDQIVEVRDIGRGQLWKWALEKHPRCEVEWDFQGSIEDDEAKAPVNPLTGTARWLAKQVMRQACAEDASMGVVTSLPGAAHATKPKTWADFVAASKGLKKPQAIIEGFAWPGIVHGVIAAPGVGKSLWALHCAVSALHGVAPRDGGAARPQPHILGVMGEDSDAIVWERAHAVATHHVKTATAPKTSFDLCINKPLELMRLDEKTRRIEKRITGGLHQVCDALEALAADDQDPAAVVLVFDMLRHAFFGNDNERWQIDAIFRVWKALMSEWTKATGRDMGIVFTHHMTKAASRKNEGGFASAGSIGIEGNSRVITEMRVLGDGREYVELKVTKTNYGVTGQREFYRKKGVDSVYGGTDQTVVLEPVTEQDALYGDSAVKDFQMMEAVKALHKWATTGAGQGVVISHGKRAVPGTMTPSEAVRTAGVHVFDSADTEALIAAGVKAGAFEMNGRLDRKDVSCKTVLKVRTGWTPPATSAGADFEDGSDV